MDKWLVSCRVCQKRCGEFLTLDSIIHQQRRLIEIFNNCTGLAAIKGDKLPQLICQQCVEQLRNMETFLCKARGTDKILRRKISDLSPDRGVELRRVAAETVLNAKLRSSIRESSYIDDVELSELQTRNSEDTKEKNEPKSAYSVCSKVNMLADVNMCNKQKSNDVEALLFYDDEDTQQSYADAQSVSSDQNVDTEEYVEIERLDTTTEIAVRKVTRQLYTNYLSKPGSNQVILQNLEQEKLHAEPEPVSMEKRKNFKCNTCAKSFSTTQKLQQHHLVHTKARDFECNICGKRFATIYRQRDHLKTHSNEREFSCDCCDKRFVTRANLKTHALSHSAERPYECEVCGKRFQLASTLKTHMALHTGKKVECDICHRKFSRVGQLNIHSRVHTGERPYKCNHCSKAYVQKSHLERHIGVHLGIRYQCPNCPRTYTKKSSLDVHLQQEHVRSRVYECAICGLKFDKQKSWYYHMKKHESVNGYQPTTLDSKQINNA